MVMIIGLVSLFSFISDDKSKKSAKVIGSSIGVSVLLVLSFIIYGFRKWKQKRPSIGKAVTTLSFLFFCLKTLIISYILIVFGVSDQAGSQDLPMKKAVLSSMGHISRENKTEDLELPLMEFDAVAIATDNFSDANKLGQGGFGIVYKGRLLEGKEIAVKRQSKTSVQGNDEFMN
ncbi:unnamed protein product [Brassica rapa]|uniref:S-locus receptor kinase domain-containing protein n=1 Tax=Brassica campestris TaxID=3711 RepID=A0A8D9CVZ1_BRACM|nr:unnamed protein product [Brassica rapa]